MVRLIALIAALAGPASAADWQYGAFDNGAWFEANVSHASGEMAFNCGGPSPGGQPLPQSDEPMTTAPYTLQVTLAQPGLGGDLTVLPPPRDDLMIVSGSTGYRLPRVVFDELNGSGWIVALSFGDPLVADLMQSPGVAVDDAAGRQGLYGADGLGPALTRMIAFCDARWAAVGEPLPATVVGVVNAVREQRVDISPTVDPAQPAQAAAPRTDDGLWNAVQAHIATSCEGAASALHDGYAKSANLDGDGVADYVISWDAIECAGPYTRPFCGASQCAVDIFVSSVYRPGARPESLYAAAVEIGPGPEGRDVLMLAGRLANCNEPGAPADCIFHWAWRNGTLERIR